MNSSMTFSITEESQVGEARRSTATLARQLEFSETDQGRLAIIVTEAARNLVRHAKGGMLALRPLEGPDETGIEVLTLDKGPGMADVTRSLRDGFSTGGTAGTGLGAMQRLADVFDIYSQLGSGTVLLARCMIGSKERNTTPQTSRRFESGVLNVPATGEIVCGDSWAKFHYPQRTLYMLCDGLGHGPQAAEAAREAKRIFSQRTEHGPLRILEDAHAALRATRGAAMAITEIDTQRAQVRFAGVGNIAASLWSLDKSQSLVSHNGIVGAEARKIQEFVYPWQRDYTLLMHSDGLSTHTQLRPYPGLLMRHPAIIAGVLYRDFQRGRDDATVLVARYD